MKTEAAEGVAVFRVVWRQIINFDYGNLPSTVVSPPGIAPGSRTDAFQLSYTYKGRVVEDLLYHDDADTLIHAEVDFHPHVLEVMPYWITGYLQADYHDILTADADAPFGWLVPPVEVISIPKVHLAFLLRNPLGSEYIYPYVTLKLAVYTVRYITDVDLIYDVIWKKYKPEPKWFTVYGTRAFSYDFRENMKITRLIPVYAEKPEIDRIVNEWRGLGVWL